MAIENENALPVTSGEWKELHIALKALAVKYNTRLVAVAMPHDADGENGAPVRADCIVVANGCPDHSECLISIVSGAAARLSQFACDAAIDLREENSGADDQHNAFGNQLKGDA